MGPHMFITLFYQFPFALITGILVATGDVIAQQVVEKKGRSHDIRRTARMAVVGLGIGTILRPWYLTLDRIIKGQTKIDALKKMVIDQSVASPTIIFTFYTLKETIEGKTFAEYKKTLQERYFATLQTNYKFWPLVQIINFSFIPLENRILFVNVAAIFWNTYLSWMAYKPTPGTTIDIDLENN